MVRDHGVDNVWVTSHIQTVMGIMDGAIDSGWCTCGIEQGSGRVFGAAKGQGRVTREQFGV